METAITKISTGRKESYETHYWLRVIRDSIDICCNICYLFSLRYLWQLLVLNRFDNSSQVRVSYRLGRPRFPNRKVENCLVTTCERVDR